MHVRSPWQVLHEVLHRHCPSGHLQYPHEQELIKFGGLVGQWMGSEAQQLTMRKGFLGSAWSQPNQSVASQETSLGGWLEY